MLSSKKISQKERRSCDGRSTARFCALSHPHFPKGHQKAIAPPALATEPRKPRSLARRYYSDLIHPPTRRSFLRSFVRSPKNRDWHSSPPSSRMHYYHCLARKERKCTYCKMVKNLPQKGVCGSQMDSSSRTMLDHPVKRPETTIWPKALRLVVGELV